MYIIQNNNNEDIIKEFKIDGIVKEDKIYDNAGNYQTSEYELQVKVIADKKELILKDIKKAEIYVSPNTIAQLENRRNIPFESINAPFNETILNSDLGRLNSLRNCCKRLF